MLGPEFGSIERAIPDDHSRKVSAEELLSEGFGHRGAEAISALDLGCGDGRGFDVLRSVLPRVSYRGVDIEGSPEVDSRTRDDAEFRSYNGADLPWPDESFDLVYSRQVFEHVRHPDRVTSEVRRVLRPGGRFIGSLSNLEPYHSFSIFNYTPYGLFRLIEDNGMRLLTMRPGPEGISLIVRQLTMRRVRRFELAYPMIAAAGRLRGWSPRIRNYLKLRFSGHICFVAERRD